MGGPVEKDVGRASGGQPWAPRPPTRPRSGGGPVGGEYGRGSGSGSVVPSLARPSSGGGGPAEWPDLGTSVRGKTSKQSLSAERDGRTNEVVHSELLPPRPSSRSEPREALPPRPSNQPGADDQAHERKSSPVPKSAHFESDEARIRQDDGPFGRSEMRSVSPFRTPGEVRNPSQPSSPERHPSKALDASKSNHSNAVETRGNQVKSMETEKPDPGSVALPDAGPDQEDASNADPDADRNQISDQTPAVHAPSELNPETNRSDKPNANGRVPQNPAQTAELDLGVLKPTGHENVQNGSKASNGFSDGSGESCGDRSGQTSETQKSGLKEERSVPLEFLARKGSDGNGHGQRRSREASPVTSNPERIQGLQWREDRSRMQANETAYPRPYAQSSATSYDRRGKNGERSAVREMGRGQSDERSGISYGGRGQNGWRPDIRGRSVERRFSPEPRQGQNGWGGGNGYERQGSGQNRYSSPGQNDWKQRPSSDPQVSPGGLVSAADEYRRGAYEHGAAYNPPPGAYGGNPEGPGSEGYQKNGTPSKSNLEAAAPAFVPRPLMRSNSGPGGRSHQPVPSASGSGAYRNQPRQDFGQNGSGSGAYSHQPGRDAGSGNGAPPGWDAGRGGSGNGAYSHYSGEHAGQGGLGNGASSHQPGWDAGQHNGGYGAYSNQPGQSNGGGSGVSEAWNYERENGSKVSGQAASNDDEKQPERIPSVDVAWFFDSASTPKSASAGGKQISDGSGEASTGAVSPQQSLAMFFPKETPKKGATD